MISKEDKSKLLTKLDHLSKTLQESKITEVNRLGLCIEGLSMAVQNDILEEMLQAMVKVHVADVEAHGSLTKEVKEVSEDTLKGLDLAISKKALLKKLENTMNTFDKTTDATSKGVALVLLSTIMAIEADELPRLVLAATEVQIKIHEAEAAMLPPGMIDELREAASKIINDTSPIEKAKMDDWPEEIGDE